MAITTSTEQPVLLGADTTLEEALQAPVRLAGRVVQGVTTSTRISRLARGWAPLLVDLVTAAAVTTALTTAVGLGQRAALVVPGAWVALLVLCGVHDTRASRSPGDHRTRRSAQVLRAGALLGLGCWVLTATTTTAAGSDELVLVTLAITVATILGHELLALTGLAPATPAVRVVVAGGPAQTQAAVTELERTTTHEVLAVCTIGDDGPVDPARPPQVLRGLEAVVTAADVHGADAVVVLPHESLDSRSLQRLGWELERSGTALMVGTGLLDVAHTRTTVTDAAGLRLLHVRPAVHHGPVRVLKEVWERAAAVAALLVLAPLLLALAVVIRRGSSGPALFRQERVGRDGRCFTMLKFRTMTTDAAAQVAELAPVDEGNGVLFKIRVDPRVTTAGRWLRRYSLDELPQLINVARGEMALVGPRPALPCEVARYDHDPKRRLAVRPGLTGLWQVSGRSDLSWEDSVRLDLLYVDNWSLGLDASILLRTVRAVLGHRGAY